MHKTRIHTLHLSPWRWYATHPWEILTDVPRQVLRTICWYRQRMIYGYADCDLWSLDWYLLTWLPSAIRWLRDNGHGYPGRDEEGGRTAEEWNATLTRMADGLEANLRSMDDHGEPDYAALELLVKWFFHLWD